ncbi:hypothetical protein BS78_05G153400 [Paspalum vaginatum]|nr:hypothetical protein BS78_05G153400 [Paspalum vaginatum]
MANLVLKCFLWQVRRHPSGAHFTITNVYAPSDHAYTEAFLAELSDLHTCVQGPWLLVGDFNLVRGAADKNNGRVDLRLCTLFNDTLHEIGVQELPLLDCQFTWSNMRESPTLARLDRAFINNEYSTAYPSANLTSTTRTTSDHKPLLVSFSSTVPKSNIFRFENAWLKNTSFLPAVLPVWHGCSTSRDAAGSLAGKLKAVRAAAKRWAKQWRAPPCIIPNCKFLILLLDSLEEGRALSPAERQVRRLCADRLHQELRERAAYWKQRGKHKAIREGDANTAFHHARATQRRRRNQISCIMVEGQAVTDHNGIVAAATSYYKMLMGQQVQVRWAFDLATLYPAQGSDLGSLDGEFVVAEVVAAIRGMDKNSAPGPDGFGPSFYNAAWQTIKEEVMALLCAFHSGHLELERINRSYLVLLPKKPAALEMTDFRPICLQNSSVKIVSKVLTTRLQGVIGKLIHLDQTGFLKGRSISENFVYAMELVQCCHKRRLPTLVLKLDFAKAFDTVQWPALMDVLAARGFSQKWRGWVHHLLSSSKTAILLNGCPGPWFEYKRGLRQGDPISPYLFLLVADVLQRLIAEDGLLHPIQQHMPAAFLQYADDTLIVMKGDPGGVQRLVTLLKHFSEATELAINYSKSVLVPMHMQPEEVAACVECLGCRQEGFPQTYLGLPLSSTKLRLEAFCPLIAKADRYLAGWQAALLNPMGRLVLVNSVLDSQLVHHMSSLLLAPGTLKVVDQRRRGFLWAGSSQASGARCLVAWEDVCATKEEGGLGVRHLATQNACLLLKLLHRLHTATTSS